MALKLMYITRDVAIARIAEESGVYRIFVDLEYIGKAARQGGMDTVQNRHTFADIRAVADTLGSAELLVRVNPIHDRSADYVSSREEIDTAIENGAQLLMLPYFKTADEVRRFIDYTDGRAKTVPLVETPEAVAVIDEILSIDGIDELYIGLNDLSLGYGRKFMFELLADGTVEELAYRFRKKGIPFGFGGIAAPGGGLLPAERIIREHYRLGSGCAILSRSFCNTSLVTEPEEIRRVFTGGIRAIRECEREAEEHARFFTENIHGVREGVESVLRAIGK